MGPDEFFFVVRFQISYGFKRRTDVCGLGKWKKD